MVETVKIKNNYEFGDAWNKSIVKKLNEYENNVRQVFDWDKLVNWLTENREVKNLFIGLNGDFKYTYNRVIRDGRIDLELTQRGYFSSHHCVPIFTENMEDGFECWVWGTETEYKARTFWPKHCIEALNGIYKI